MPKYLSFILVVVKKITNKRRFPLISFPANIFGFIPHFLPVIIESICAAAKIPE